MPGKPRRRRCPGCHSWICWHMERCWPCMYSHWDEHYPVSKYAEVWKQKPDDHPEKQYPCSCGCYVSPYGETDDKGRHWDCFRLEQVGYTGLLASDLCPVCLGGAIKDPCQPSHRR